MVSEAVHDISLKFTGEDDGLRRIGVTAELFWFHAVVVSAIIVSVWITWPMWVPATIRSCFP
jgi:hypothetical protein